MQKITIGEICDIINGFAFKSEKYTDTGFRVIRISNVQNGYIEDKSPVFVSCKMEDIEQYKLEENDLLLSLTGNVGRVALLSSHYLPAVLNQRVACLRMKDTRVSKKFLYYYMNSDFFKQSCLQQAKGIAQKNMSTEWLKMCDIPLYAIKEQETLVNILDKISDSINMMIKQLGQLDSLVQGRFVEMFGDPVSNPFGWDKRPLSKMILNANNGMARRGNDVNGNIVLRLVELQQGYVNYSAPNRIILNNKEKEKYCLKENDFLFARVNGNPENVGRCAVFHEVDEPIYHNDHIIRVHFDEDKLNGVFVSTLLNSEYGKQQMHAQIKTSAGQYTISQEGIGAIEVILPPLFLQERFADLVGQVDKSKFVIQKSIDKLQLLFDSLMQQYFG